MREEFERKGNIGYTLKNKDYDLITKELDEMRMLGTTEFGFLLVRPHYLDDILSEKHSIPRD